MTVEINRSRVMPVPIKPAFALAAAPEAAMAEASVIGPCRLPWSDVESHPVVKLPT